MASTGFFTVAGRNLALNLLLRNTGTRPASQFLALATAPVTADTTASTATEVVDSGYARQPITFGAPATEGAYGKSKNSSPLSFGPFTAGGVAITHAFIVDTLLPANNATATVLFGIDLGTTKYSNAGEAMTVNVNDLIVGLQ